MKATLTLILAICTVGLRAAEPEVTNVRAGQRPGTILIDITYDMANAEGDKVKVSVEVSEDGGKTYGAPAGVLSGDVGLGIAPGVGKRVVWEAGVEWLGRTASNLVFRVTASSRTPIPGMVWIAPGSFVMGSPAGEQGRDSDEGPQTEVTMARGYWLGKCEVKQGEWEAVMGSNPSRWKDSDLPVESLTWDQAMEYCRKLTERERGAGRLPNGYEYSLPTEAQWEYACRAGTTMRYSFGDREADLGQYAWHEGNSGGRTHPVGQKGPNSWGLHDMHGNVWEWCLDWYQDRLPGGRVTDPPGSGLGSFRVYRGGSWINLAQYCRSANRIRFAPSDSYYYLGFRVALVPAR